MRVTKREKRACRQCVDHHDAGAAAAHRRKRLGERPRWSSTRWSRSIAIILPLYRQQAMLEREAGVEISRATLDGWVMRVGELLQPVVGAMRQDLLGESYLQADETTVPVQMHDKRGADHQAYLWQYGKPGGETVFEFQLGRGREGPRKFLGSGKGFCKPTAIRPTTTSAAEDWCTWAVGRIIPSPALSRAN